VNGRLGHLGPVAAALVDEQLDRPERDRALRHLAACDRCRREVGEQRAMKARLDRMSEPQLPDALLDKLQAMRPVPMPPVQQMPPVPPATTRASRSPALPVRVEPRQVPLGGLGGTTMRRRARRVLVGATSLVLIGGGAAYAAGGADPSGAPVRPAVDVYTVQHGTTSGTVPLNDPAVSAVTVGFGR
jgi:anti-sigma factor RsiW